MFYIKARDDRLIAMSAMRNDCQFFVMLEAICPFGFFVNLIHLKKKQKQKQKQKQKTKQKKRFDSRFGRGYFSRSSHTDD